MVMRAIKGAWRTRNFLIIFGIWLVAFSPRWMPPIEGWAFPASRVDGVEISDSAGGAILAGELEKLYDDCAPLGAKFWHRRADEPWILMSPPKLLRSPVGRPKGSWQWGPYQLPMRAAEIGLLEVQFTHRCSYRLPFTDLHVWNPFWDRQTTILRLHTRELIASM